MGLCATRVVSRFLRNMLRHGCNLDVLWFPSCTTHSVLNPYASLVSIVSSLYRLTFPSLLSPFSFCVFFSYHLIILSSFPSFLPTRLYTNNPPLRYTKRRPSPLRLLFRIRFGRPSKFRERQDPLACRSSRKRRRAFILSIYRCPYERCRALDALQAR